MKPSSSLKNVLTITFISISALPIMIVGYFSLLSFTKNIEKEIAAKNLLIAKSISYEIEAYLNEPIQLLKQLQFVSNATHFQDTTAIDQYLGLVLSEYSYFDMILVLDRLGNVKHHAPFSKNMDGIDMSGQDFFRKALTSGKIEWSPTFVSPEKEEPTLTVSLPIRDGMVVGHFSLANLKKITARITSGIAGTITIVDHTGTVIAHPNYNDVLHRKNLKNSPAVQLGQTDEKRVLKYTTNGIERVGSIAKVPATNWLIIISQPVDDAYHSLQQSKNIIIVGSMAAIILAIGLSYYSLNRILRPLFTLTDRAKKIASGHYLSKKAEPSYAEINDLANSFDTMIEAIRTREEELRHLRNYLSNIINSMPSIMVGVNPDATVTLWNNEAAAKTGIAADKAIQQPLEHIFPDLRSEIERIKEAMHTRRVHAESRQPRELDGETFFENVTIYPLVANGVDGAVIRIDDVTRQVKLEEIMIQSEKMRSVGGLAAGMAHEINNPLSGIMQTVQVVLGRLQNTALPANAKAAKEAGTSIETIADYMEKRKVVEMLNRVHDSGKRAAEIVQNMLSFSRKGSSLFSLHNIPELLDKCVDLCKVDYDLKKKYDFREIEIIREYDADIPEVPCEAGKIQQVFINILKNGAEAMWETDSRPRFHLRARYESHSKFVKIWITDNGPGIPNDVCKRIFEPFYTTKKADKGTGLGLSISYFIITDNHGGEMTVTSTPEQGTTFSIGLPVSPDTRPSA